MRYNDPFLKTFFEAPDGVIVFALNKDYCFTFFSAACSRIIEDRHNIRIKAGDSILPLAENQEALSNLKTVLDRALNGESFSLEIDLIGKTPPRACHVVNFNPVSDANGNIIGLTGYINDISGTKHAIHEKSEADAAYEMLMANTNDAIFVMHAEGPNAGRIVSANEAAAKMHGYSHEEFLTLNIKNIDSPEDREKFEGRLSNLLKGEKLSFEVNHKRKDGKSFPLEVITWLMSINGEKFTMSINRDITERREIVETVRDRERFIESITSSSPDVIYVFDIKSRKNVYSNRHMTHLLGYTDDDINNMSPESIAALLHPEDIELYPSRLARWQNATDDDVIETEFRMKNKTGEWRWFLARDTVFKRDKEGNAIQTVGTAQDRTDAKKAELDLRQSEERFKRLQEASFGGIAVHDMGKIIDANQGLADLTGFPLGELIGMDGLQLIAEEYREHVIQKIRTGYELPYDVIGLSKNGHRYHLEVKAKNIPFQNRMVRVTEFRDISDRKLIEESIREQNIRLGDIADNLTRKNEQLEEFTQIVSHNLRAPAGNIVTLLSLYDSAGPEEQSEYIQLLRNSSNLLLGTLNELNEVLKIKQTRKIETQELQFSTVFNNVRQMLSASINELGAEMNGNFFEAPVIQYPNIYLESILLNLLSNALKYHSPDRKPVIRVRSYREAKKVMLEVEDNGLGINLERYGHQIFKMRKNVS
ncbi:MAG: PAS domain S-box protein [Bacteroidota bacterium]